ncbi:membrane hypothetical protein [Magnetospirillum sp. LM-5]|uniref:hypothetical protein n=1 Tax=Magnetospirillum sp. LM-5 TaxID=2681466 RepID=UPI00138624E9|nr:hypothetical protein [Magnetospirillum sp. LM-5]CAA7622670.1 membrane hypothetical protein [Magnetospirillum sp. LM-5]
MRGGLSVAGLGRAAALLALFAAAVALTVNNGLSGFTFDSDPVYYGGYMVAKGLWPYIDWSSSYAVLPAVIEGGFMRLFGTGWHVSALHAGLTNGLFAVLAYRLFRHFGLGPVAAYVYAAAAAVTYYAPIGYGTPDKPSFLFLMVALVLQAAALKSDRPGRVGALYVGVTLAVVATLLSKLNPTVLYAIPLLAMFFGLTGPGRLAALLAGLGTVLVLAAVFGLIELAHTGFLANLGYYAVKLPLLAGSQRVGGEGSFAYSKLATYTHLGTFNLLYGLMAAGVALLWLRRDQLFDGGNGYARLILPVLLGVSFWAVTVFHLSTIAQPWPAHVTLVVPAVALLHAAIAAAVRATSPLHGESAATALRLLAVALTATVAMDAKEYQRVVGKPRLIFDLRLELGETQPRGSVGIDAFRYLRWIPTLDEPHLAEEIRDVVTAMRSVPGNVFVLGMPNHYYVFADKAPLLPAMVVLAGHTTPPVGSDQEARLIARFKENVERAEVRHLVTSRTLADGLAKEFLASRHVCHVTDVGRRAVLAELCGDPLPDYARVSRILYGFVPRQDGVPSLD